MNNRFLRNIILIIISLMLCLPLYYASADGFECNIQVLSETNEVVITGKVPLVYVGFKATIEVINPGKSLSNLVVNNPLSMMDIINYMEDTTIASDGTYSFRYTNYGETGEYTVNIGISGKTTAYTATYNFYSGLFEKQVIEELNTAKKAKDAVEFQKIFTDNYSKLNINNVLYNQLSSQGKDLTLFYELMAKSPAVLAVNELKSQTEAMLITYIVNTAPSASEMKTLLETYKTQLQLEVTSAYGTYLSSGVMDAVCEEFVRTDFLSISDIETAFQNQTIRLAVLKANGWESVKKILADNSALLKIDITKPNKLKAPSEVYRRLAGKDLATLGDVKNAFDKSVIEVANAENDKGSSGGGGGGGGSSQGGSYTLQFTDEAPISKPADQEVFNDLTSVDWAKSSIVALYQKGIINGKGEKTFAPNDTVTREEFVKLLVMGMGLYDKEAEVSFKDVSKNEWYYSYVASAVKAGLITGKGEKTFGVGEVITREDMATMAYRAIISKDSGLKASASEYNFQDAKSISSYAVEGIAFMQSKKIILGTDEGQFLPKNYSTRVQAAVIIYRLIEFLENV